MVGTGLFVCVLIALVVINPSLVHIRVDACCVPAVCSAAQCDHVLGVIGVNAAQSFHIKLGEYVMAFEARGDAFRLTTITPSKHPTTLALVVVTF